MKVLYTAWTEHAVSIVQECPVSGDGEFLGGQVILFCNPVY